MKKLILSIIFLMFVGLYADTNIDNDMNNLTNSVAEMSILIDDWNVAIGEVKAGNFSWGLFGSMLLLLLVTVPIMGLIIISVINMIQFFTSDKIDSYFFPVENWVNDNMILLPSMILKKLNIRKPHI